jgi:hypothetical protein
MCLIRLEEQAVDVMGRFYRAMSGGRAEVASVACLYNDDSVRAHPQSAGLTLKVLQSQG